MKTIPSHSNRCLSSAPADGVHKDAAEPEASADCEPLRHFTALFRSRWNCAILRILRPRSERFPPPQLRRFQINQRLPGAVEKSVSNALDTLEDAGLIERTLPPSTRGTLYSLTPDGLSVLPMLGEVNATCGRFHALLRRAHERRQTARKRRARRQKRAKR